MDSEGHTDPSSLLVSKQACASPPYVFPPHDLFSNAVALECVPNFHIDRPFPAPNHPVALKLTDVAFKAPCKHQPLTNPLGQTGREPDYVLRGAVHTAGWSAASTSLPTTGQ